MAAIIEPPQQGDPIDSALAAIRARNKAPATPDPMETALAAIRARTQPSSGITLPVNPGDASTGGRLSQPFLAEEPDDPVRRLPAIPPAQVPDAPFPAKRLGISSSRGTSPLLPTAAPDPTAPVARLARRTADTPPSVAGSVEETLVKHLHDLGVLSPEAMAPKSRLGGAAYMGGTMLSQAASDPVGTATSIAAAPFHAAGTLGDFVGQYAAKKIDDLTGRHQNDPLFQEPKTVSRKDAAFAAAQLMTLGVSAKALPMLDKIFGKTMADGVLAARAAGESPALAIASGYALHLAARTAAGAAVGASFSPDDPEMGAILGAALAGVHAATQTPRGGIPTDAIPVANADRQLRAPGRRAQSATATPIEHPEVPTQPDVAVEGNTVEQALASLRGKASPQLDVAPPEAPRPSGPLPTDEGVKRATEPTKPTKPREYVPASSGLHATIDQMIVRNVANGLKTAHPDAIDHAAPEMAARVPKGAVLVPLPDHTGSTAANEALAYAMAGHTDATVSNVLDRTTQVGNSQELREKGKPGVTADEHEASLTATGELPKDKPVVFVDALETTGSAAEGARRVLQRPDATLVSYAKARIPAGEQAATPKQKADPSVASDEHEFSSTQLDLPAETSSKIKALGAAIPDADLAADGRETDPHVTVKYGLHGNEPEKVRELLKDQPPITVKLGKTSIFPAGESGSGDVVKVDVDSPELHALNKTIADALPHTDTHPDYKPHATVAYVKPGLGKKYAGNESLVGHTVTINSLTFSGKDGKTVDIPLKGQSAEPVGKPETVKIPDGKSEATPSEPHKYLTDESGSSVLHSIPDERVAKAGWKGGPVRITEHDVAHIEEHHGGQLAQHGYADGEAFVRDVLENYDAVYRAKGEPAIYLAKRNGHSGALVAQLEPGEGGTWRVTSGRIMRTERLEQTRELLWESPRDDSAGPGSSDNLPSPPHPPEGSSPPGSQSPTEPRDGGPQQPRNSKVAGSKPKTKEPPPEAAVVGPSKTVSEDGVDRFVDPRTPSGARHPVKRVSTDGLIRELADLEPKRLDAEERSIYRWSQDENFHSTEDGRSVVSADYKGKGQSSRQAKALQNLSDYRNMMDEVYAELEARGLDSETIYDRTTERVAERSGMELDEAARSFNSETVTDESGHVLFEPSPRYGADQTGLFGEEAPPEPEQEGLFGEKEGTDAARDLATTERAARGELDWLRQRARLEKNPEKSAKLAQRIALLAKFVDRASAISSEELSVRARAQPEAPPVPDQGTLLEQFQLALENPAGAEANAIQKQNAEIAFGSEAKRDAAVSRHAKAMAALEASKLPTAPMRLRQVRAHQNRQQYIDFRGVKVETVEDMARIMDLMRDPQIERMNVFALDRSPDDPKVATIRAHTVETSGALNFLDMTRSDEGGHPSRWIRGVIDMLKRVGATDVVVGHNHPSGEAVASDGDKGFTRMLANELQKAGIRLVGHIGIDDTEYFWIKPDGATSDRVSFDPQRTREPAYDVGERPLQRPADVARTLGAVVDPTMSYVTYLDSQHKVVAVEPRAGIAIGTIRKWLPQQLRALGARSVVVVAPDDVASRLVQSMGEQTEGQYPIGRPTWSNDILDVQGIQTPARGVVAEPEAGIILKSYSQHGPLSSNPGMPRHGDVGRSVHGARPARLVRPGARGTVRSEPGIQGRSDTAASVTDSPAFKRWFGDSKIVDAEGKPQRLYHQTHVDVVPALKEHGFDLSKGRARLGDHEMPDGIFLKPTDTDIGVGATTKRDAAQVPLYARIENPLRVANREGLLAWLSRDAAYKRLANEATTFDRQRGVEYRAWQRAEQDRMKAAGWPDGEYRAYIDEAGVRIKEWIAENERLSTLARERGTAVLKAAGHDGLVVDRDEGSLGRSVTTVVAFEPTQVKSADDNSGAFDPNNPSIVAEDSPPEYGDEDPTTGVKNAVSEATRASLGMDERTRPEPRTQAEMYDAGKATAAADPTAIPRLLDALRADPEKIVGTQTEAGLLLKHRVDLDNKLHELITAKADAQSMGDAPAEELARLQLAAHRETIKDFVKLAERTGTATGRALAARKMMSKLDYSLSNMEATSEAAKGSSLTPQELERIKALYDQIQEKLVAAEQDVTNARGRAAKAEADLHHANLRLEVAGPIADRITARLDTAAEKAMARIRRRGMRAMAGMDPEDLADHAIIGAAQLAKGLRRFADWSEAMVQKLGRDVEPHLQEIFEASGARLDEEIDREAPPAPTKAKAPTAKAPTDTKAKMRVRVMRDEATLSELRPYLRRLALDHIRGGMTEREAVLDALHDDVKTIMPEATRTEVRDALSGYGDFTPLDKAADKARLREIQAESQKLAQLEALHKGQAPLATGFERPEPNDETRRLTQQVNAAKKAAGILVGADDATRLKSALASAKTRTRNAIKDLQTEIDTGERIVRGKPTLIADAELHTLKLQLAELRKTEADVFKKPGLTDEQRLERATAAAKRSAEMWQDRLDKARKGVFGTAARTARLGTNPELDALRAQSKAAREAFDELKALDPTEQQRETARSNQQYRARLAQREAELLGRIAHSDYAARPVRPGMTMDAESLKRKADVERVKAKFNAGLRAYEKANRPKAVKAADYWASWVRLGVLTSPVTFAKLLGAAAARTITTPVEQVIGYGISKAVPRLAARAPRHGVPSAMGMLRAEAQAQARMWTSGIKGAGQHLLNRHTDLELVHDPNKMPPEWKDYVGMLHAAFKNPVFEAEYARSYYLRTEHAISDGQNTMDPLVHLRLSSEAYLDAKRSIFRQPNAVTRGFRSGLRSLEMPSKETGKVSKGAMIVSAAVRTELPIVSIPTNFAHEILEIATGLPTGAYQAFNAYREGIEDLKPVEADAIMRQLKKGAIGAALMALGFFLADKAGGLYLKGEKPTGNDKKPGDIGSVDKKWLHNPYADVVQVGASVRHVGESYAKKHDTDPQGYVTGVKAAAFGLLDEVPFVREASVMANLLDGKTRDKALDTKLASLVVPLGVQWVAKQMDDSTRRDPVGLTQHIEANVPGLRQRVPEEDPRKAMQRLRTERRARKPGD